jgi:hypothetical protein
LTNLLSFCLLISFVWWFTSSILVCSILSSFLSFTLVGLLPLYWAIPYFLSVSWSCSFDGLLALYWALPYLLLWFIDLVSNFSIQMSPYLFHVHRSMKCIFLATLVYSIFICFCLLFLLSSLALLPLILIIQPKFFSHFLFWVFFFKSFGLLSRKNYHKSRSTFRTKKIVMTRGFLIFEPKIKQSKRK